MQDHGFLVPGALSPSYGSTSEPIPDPHHRPTELPFQPGAREMGSVGVPNTTQTEEDPRRSSRFRKGGYKDRWVAVVFFIQLLATVVVAIYGMAHPIHNPRDKTTQSMVHNYYDEVLWMLLASFMSTALLAGTIEWMKISPQTFIPRIIMFKITFCILLFMMLLYRNQLPEALAVGATCMMLLGWWWCFRARIPFASILLGHTIRVVDDYKVLGLYSYCLIGFAISYVIIWAFASRFHYHITSHTIPWMTFWGWLLMWSVSVFQNMVYVVSAGITGMWYFAVYPFKISRPFRRAHFWSFGSVCVGSFPIPGLSLFHSILKRGLGGVDSGPHDAWYRIFSILETGMFYFNTYAFSHVAIYGKSYFTAASDTRTLITSTGLDQAINDSLIGSAMVMLSIASGVEVGACIAILSRSAEVFVLGCIIGISIMGISLSLYSSAIITIYVCYAEEPASLQFVDLTLYQYLRSGVAGGVGMELRQNPA